MADGNEEFLNFLVDEEAVIVAIEESEIFFVLEFFLFGDVFLSDKLVRLEDFPYFLYSSFYWDLRQVVRQSHFLSLLRL